MNRTARSSQPQRRSITLCFLAGVMALITAAQADSGAGTAAPAPPPPAVLPATPTRTVLSIDSAVSLALKRNPSLDEAAAAVRRAEAAVDEVRSLRQPNLQGGINATVQGPIPVFTFAQPAQNGQPATVQEIKFGREFTRNFSLQSRYDLDPFGRLRNSKAAALRGVETAKGTLFQARNELVHAVQNIYLGALRARELIRVSEEAIQAANEQLRVAEAQFRAGISPEFDVIRARVQVANLRQGLVTAESNRKRTEAALARLLALEPDQGVELSTVQLPPEPDAVLGATARRVVDPAPSTSPGSLAGSAIPGDLSHALAEAFTARPELYRAIWARRASEARADLERKGKLPTAGLVAAFSYNPDQAGLAVVFQNWSLVANITIPIFDAGLTRARSRQAKADVSAAAAQLEGVRNGLVEEVKNALTDLDDSRERRRAAAANVVQAKEALRIARVRYSAGLSANVEVIDAESALTQARTNDVNAAYDYLAALANLNRSLGRYAQLEESGVGRDRPTVQ